MQAFNIIYIIYIIYIITPYTILNIFSLPLVRRIPIQYGTNVPLPEGAHPSNNSDVQLSTMRISHLVH